MFFRVDRNVLNIILGQIIKIIQKCIFNFWQNFLVIFIEFQTYVNKTIYVWRSISCIQFNFMFLKIIIYDLYIKDLNHLTLKWMCIHFILVQKDEFSNSVYRSENLRVDRKATLYVSIRLFHNDHYMIWTERNTWFLCVYFETSSRWVETVVLQVWIFEANWITKVFRRNNK